MDENGDSGELFGRSVAVSGATIVVGAPDHEVGKNVAQGAMYVFTMPVSGWAGSPTQTAELTASDGAKDEQLGGSLAVSGDTIVAGASSKEVGKNALQGAVEVFVKPTSGWVNATQTAELTASNGTAGDSLGRSVAVSGQTIVAGAPDHEVRKILAQGAVYMFTEPSRR
jgi:fructose-specific component phosphotransferase system IIB-like protein